MRTVFTRLETLKPAWLLVPGAGIEPARSFLRGILSPETKPAFMRVAALFPVRKHINFDHLKPNGLNGSKIIADRNHIVMIHNDSRDDLHLVGAH